jgi:NADPH-dependent ferric siderophore reductase
MTIQEAQIYRGTVLRRSQLSPHMMRITVHAISGADAGEHVGEHVGEHIGTGSETLSPFTSTGHADEFIALTIPGVDPASDPIRRYYTIREYRSDTGEMDVDFVMHGHGPAATWAAAASPGEILQFERPRGHYDPPAESQWIGLVGDATALPAIARILDERRGGPDAHIIIALGDERDRLDLTLRAGDRVRWLHDSDDIVAAALALTDLPGAGYLWFSGEASAMRTVRGHVRKTLGWPTEKWDTMAYWRRDHERWLRRCESHGPDLVDTIERIFASDEDPELQRDQADELFVRYGL